MNTPAPSQRFPLPSSLQVVPGTERAQAAYPPLTQFTAAGDDRFWLYNSMDFPELMCAFDLVSAESPYCVLASTNTQVHSTVAQKMTTLIRDTRALPKLEYRNSSRSGRWNAERCSCRRTTPYAQGDRSKGRTSLRSAGAYPLGGGVARKECGRRTRRVPVARAGRRPSVTRHVDFWR